MNDLEYLNQIAATNRPMKPGFSLAKLFRTKAFKIAAGAIVAVVLVVVLAAVIAKVTGKEKELLVRINMRVSNVSTSITNYSPQVKSSSLRGMGASFVSIMSETSRDLYAILLAEYGYNPESLNTEMMAEEAGHTAELDMALENAKLNGLLDRVYRQQLIYETQLLISMESEALERTGSGAVQAVLKKATDSLTVLLAQLSAYSDSTN